MKLTECFCLGRLLVYCFETPGWSRTRSSPQAHSSKCWGHRCELLCLAYYFLRMVFPELLELRTNPQLAAICIRTPGVMPTGIPPLAVSGSLSTTAVFVC